jgi:hypothetical protein
MQKDGCARGPSGVLRRSHSRVLLYCDIQHEPNSVASARLRLFDNSAPAAQFTQIACALIVCADPAIEALTASMLAILVAFTRFSNLALKPVTEQ